MKKIHTMLLMVVMAATAQAQVLFSDGEGRTYGDGEVMLLNTFEDPDWGDLMCPAPELVNKGSQSASVKMEVKITQIPNGTTLADCFSGGCVSYSSTGSHTTATKTIGAGKSLSTAIEWNCWSDALYDYAQGSCWVEFTLYVGGQKDKTVTVIYNNGDAEAETGICTLPTTEKAEGTCYTLDGRKASAKARGIVVRDGKKFINN